MRSAKWIPLLLLALPLLAIVAVLAWQNVDGDPTVAAPGPARPSTGPTATPPSDDGSEPQRSRVDPVVAVADRSLRVRGRVVDAYGEAVGSALVGEPLAHAPFTTRADGLFELSVDVPEGPLTLLVIADGYAPLATQHEVAGALELDAGDLQLRPGGGLRGTVVDAAGSAVPQASVALRATSRSAWPATVDPAALLEPVTGDAQGGYAFAQLVPGSYEVTATAPGWQAGRAAAVAVRDAEQAVVPPIVLAPGHQLAGVVLGPGDRPVAAAKVRVRHGPNPPRFDMRTETNEQGRFALASLPPGPLRLEVEREGFLGHGPAEVDPTRGEELVVRLEAGLGVAVTVVDATTGAAVEQFAPSIQRLGAVDAANGSIEQQLERRLGTLRAAAVSATDAAVRDRHLQLITELDARLARQQHEATVRPAAIPADVGVVSAHADGRFTFDGLQEGRYTVGIASPDHQFARSQPFELRRGAAAATLPFALVSGSSLAGVVVGKGDGHAIAGARVELLAVGDEPLASAPARSLYPWLFARPGPRGIVVATAATAGNGSFTFPPVAPGRYAVGVRHPQLADHDSEVVDLNGRRQLRIEVGARASLSGRVTNALGQTGGVEVLVLGGHGTMRTVKVAADGSYRCDGLQPGPYLLRAFPSQATQYVSRLFGAIFPEHAGAVVPDRIPPRDVTLAEGEARSFDLLVERPATGSVQGTITLNGRAAAGCRTMLRPVEGEAPGAGGLPLRGEPDAQGRLAFADVPVGNYALVVMGPTRQELATQPLTVSADAPAFVQLDVPAGGLRGRVTASDGTPADGLAGYLWVLPGAGEEPADLYEYRRGKRTHRIAVRKGAFADEALTPGPAVVVLDLRGRKRVGSKVSIPTGSTLDLVLTAGERAP